jgi:hypothetical protein
LKNNTDKMNEMNFAFIFLNYFDKNKAKTIS